MISQELEFSDKIIGNYGGLYRETFYQYTFKKSSSSIQIIFWKCFIFQGIKNQYNTQNDNSTFLHNLIEKKCPNFIRTIDRHRMT